ncbi:hypothetical protein T310_6612 [Rasamsonia emersonii CBS 393.64]|uniref:Uncharacterized protein n=1 Tax=Rasamsonia emersonii (strain ATCC 16479 / CBS 393.64 / IMI 116815) TaxID=1408163 RepID=A0A0F4YNH8_RASE3|nr:hypothetical protein T310_6612 [Rasamsonia emersonii CBS 393.64]KKA19411.1 hypothetical protein T310_6612 [Rasamsonia emersonii CBS 393.64]
MSIKVPFRNIVSTQESVGILRTQLLEADQERLAESILLRVVVCEKNDCLGSDVLVHEVRIVKEYEASRQRDCQINPFTQQARRCTMRGSMSANFRARLRTSLFDVDHYRPRRAPTVHPPSSVRPALPLSSELSPRLEN